jgi:response regulator RpfG family c-di-GMP phosphodiesterase
MAIHASYAARRFPSAVALSPSRVFDGLTHARPYKEAWPVERGVDEVHRLRGMQFDPDVVEAFDQLDAEELAGNVAPAADDIEAAA